MYHSRKPEKQRYYEDEIIDLPFLLNASQVLSEAEFKLKMPAASYSQYFETFLRRKVSDLFTRSFNSAWFKERYLGDKPVRKLYSGNAQEFVHIKNVLRSTPFSEMQAKIKAVIPECEIFTSQNGEADNFTRCFFVVSNEPITEDSIRALREFSEARIVKISNRKITDLHLASLEQARALLEELWKYDKNAHACVSEAQIDEIRRQTDSAVYTDFLREKFYFCLNCCRKFDNPFEMILECSAHSTSDFLPRRFEILCYPKNIDAISRPLENFEKWYSRTQEKNYMCNQCEKIFSSSALVTDHLKNKHENIVQGIEENNAMFEIFLDNLDFFVFEQIFGTRSKMVPYYARCKMREGDAIVYDLPMVFSGDIRL